MCKYFKNIRKFWPRIYIYIMTSESFVNGLLLSSTPIQSLEDSGYYGSCKKNACASNANASNNYSPIKEFASFKNSFSAYPFLHSNAFDTYEVIQQCSLSESSHSMHHKCELSSCNEVSDIQKLWLETCELSFDNKLHKVNPHEVRFLNTSVSQHSPSISSGTEEITKNFDSVSGTKDACDLGYLSEDIFTSNKNDFSYTTCGTCLLNSSKEHILNDFKNSGHILGFKQTRINFLHELKIMNCITIISSILSYLSAEELCIASCVSKEWNRIIAIDKTANFRRRNLIKKKQEFLTGPSKENRFGVRVSSSREHKLAFCNLTNISKTDNHFPKAKNLNSVFESFIQEGKNGQIKLLKCPKCNYASKCHKRNNYVCTHCSYSFCSSCLNPFFGKHTCYTSQLPKILIGSKQSKKNLKRL